MTPPDAHTAWALTGCVAALVLAWALLGGWGRGD